METFIVILIVGAAVLLCIKNIFKKATSENGCGCNCSCSSGNSDCETSNNTQDIIN